MDRSFLARAFFSASDASRTGHSSYRQILNTESRPALPADI
ncbi:hypothetical protein FORC89_p108 (plasmid) [Salmonella sp. FORC89]|nr:hypothetical protein FORC89_p108 [Salmonella sp. FORC89]